MQGMLYCKHCTWKTGVSTPPQGMEVALAHKGFDTGDVLHKVLITYVLVAGN